MSLFTVSLCEAAVLCVPVSKLKSCCVPVRVFLDGDREIVIVSRDGDRFLLDREVSIPLLRATPLLLLPNVRSSFFEGEEGCDGGSNSE
jgi:hypothetical protein